MKRILSLFLLLIATACFAPQKTKATSNDIGNPNSKEQQNSPSQHPVAYYLSPELKKWFNALENNSPEKGKVSKAAVRVTPNFNWLIELKVNKGDENGYYFNACVTVNASDESITFGGKGLNHALARYANFLGIYKNWLRLTKSNGATYDPTEKVAEGDYVISEGYNECTDHILPEMATELFFHAVGPKATATTSLQTAKGKIKMLYYNMLINSEVITYTPDVDYPIPKPFEYIVLPALSTGLAANADYTGKSFTKNEFIAAMYEGMYEGIKQFRDENTTSKMSIILNNWTPLEVNND